MGFSDKTSATLAALKVDKDTSEPFFGIKEKTGDTWGFKSKHTKFNGVLTGLELGTYPWKGADVDTVEMTFDDKGVTVKLEMNLDNGLCRNILNSLMNESQIGEVDMEVYKNKDGYPSISIKNNGAKTDWKYKFTEFPAKQKNAKGVVIDDTEYLEFMRKLAKNLAAKLSPAPKSAMKPNPKANAVTDEELAAGGIGHKEDDPF